MSRILRSLVCLLLICCILVNLSPLKAQATGAGVVAGGIVKAASVSIPALWPIVAALAVVGITAYGIDSGAFENIANSCYSAFESAGTWINNGMAEILRTEDADGNVQFYVDGGMLEDVRSFLWDDSLGDPVLQTGAYSLPDTVSTSVLNAYNRAASHAYSVVIVWPDGYGFMYNDEYPFILSYDANNFASLDTEVNVLMNLWSSSSKKWTESYGGYVVTNNSTTPWTQYPFYFIGSMNSESVISTSYDVTLGYLSDRDTVLDDETIVTFHPYLADVVRTRTGRSGGSGEDENKWWLAVAYAETLEKLYQTSQQAQIENPSVTEIPDIQIGIEYDVTEEEDEEGKKQYYLDPIQTPGTGTDPGTGDGTDTDPDTGTDSGNGSGNTGTDSGSTGNTGSSWKPPSDHSQFALADLSKFFPFCIPFDLFDFFKLLNADPVAPSFTWEIQDLSGQTYGLTVDLSQWDSVAQLFRRLQLFLFVCGLAAASRKYIKW